jgi:hypothetical protein
MPNNFPPGHQLHGTNVDDDSEHVVLEHAPTPAMLAKQPPSNYVHHNREAVCKHAAAEITIGPMLEQKNCVGHEKSYKFVRSTDRTADGRAIFRPVGVE